MSELMRLFVYLLKTLHIGFQVGLDFVK